MATLQKPNMSLYQQLISSLETEIKNGKFSESSQLPSEEELCDIYKVSRTTVRKALAYLANEGLICRYKKRGTFITDKRTESSIPLLKCGKKVEGLSISFLVCDKRYVDPYYSRILSGVEYEASRYDIKLIFKNITAPDNGVEKKMLLEKLRSDYTAGMILVGLITPRMVDVVKSTNLPFVLVGDIARKEVVDTGLDIVAGDNYAGMAMAMEHLTSLGHSNIAFMAGPFIYSWIFSQLRSYKDALEKARLTFRKEFVAETKSHKMREGYQAMKRLLRLPETPTAVCTASYSLAVGAVEAIREAGLEVPKDISVIAAGDPDHYEGVKMPSFTRVHTEERKKGKLAVDILLRRIKGEAHISKRVVFPVKFVKGKTTMARR